MSEKKRSITIVDVANLAGVSIATASRALSGHGYASAEVKDRVRRAARQLNYRLNASARSLKIKRTNNIGLVITDITNPFYSYLADGVLDCAKETGYHVILCATNEDPEMERAYLKVLMEQRVDGIIAVPTGDNHRLWRELSEINTHLILVDREVQGLLNADTIIVDNINGAYMATQHLIQQGHQRIGIISGPETTTTGRDRMRGYYQAMQDAGLPIYQELVEAQSFIRESGYAAMGKFLSLPEPPSAVFAANNVLGEAAILAVREKGLRIPEDLSFIMFDDVPWAALIQPGISVINQPIRRMGYLSLKMLDQRLKESGGKQMDQTPMKIVMDPELIQRNSVLPLSPSIRLPSFQADKENSHPSGKAYPIGGGK